MRLSELASRGILAAVMVGVLAPSVQASGIDMQSRWWTVHDSFAQWTPGDPIFFQVGVSVDELAGGPTGNRGLAGIVYDVISPEAATQGLYFSPMSDALSGYSWQSLPSVVTGAYYVASGSSTQAMYGGGWGFDTGGLPTGGNVDDPGLISAAGISAPLFFDADVQDFFPGNQPNTRLDVGISEYHLGADDPLYPGLLAGFGQMLENGIAGDGTWMLQEGVIDTSGWAYQSYSFEVVPTSGTLFKDLDYNLDRSSAQYAYEVDQQDMQSSSFAFTPIPEPACLGLIILGGISLVRRRRP